MASTYRTPEEIRNMPMATYISWRQELNLRDWNHDLVDTYEAYRELFAMTGNQYYFDKMLEKVEPYGD